MATFNGEHFDSFKGHPCIVASNNELYLYFGYVEALSEESAVLRQARALGGYFDAEDIGFWASEGVPEDEGIISEIIETIYLRGVRSVAKCSAIALSSIQNHENDYDYDENENESESIKEYARNNKIGMAADYEDEEEDEDEDEGYDETNTEFAPPPDLLPFANALNRLDELDGHNEETDYTEAYGEESYEQPTEETSVTRTPKKRRRRR